MNTQTNDYNTFDCFVNIFLPVIIHFFMLFRYTIERMPDAYGGDYFVVVVCSFYFLFFCHFLTQCFSTC